MKVLVIKIKKKKALECLAPLGNRNVCIARQQTAMIMTKDRQPLE